MFLSPFTTINGKARSFFYLKTGETNCTSFYGYGTNTSFLDRTRTYPRTNDVSQVTSQKTARSNNSAFSASDNPTPVPFAEGGYFTNNTYITALEVGNHTKYIHKNTRFGSGISSNDSCSNESTWLLNGGCRYEVDGV
jgi:hypothetical protein